MSRINIDTLNPSQRAAVTHGEGPMLLLAGAGSGKTRVVTHRIAWLLEQGVDPDSILAVTFTNKAAREMRERIESLIGPELAKGLTVSTFHAFGAKFLRSHPEPLGRSRRFSIYDDADQLVVIKDALDDIGISDRLWPPGAVRKVLDAAKNGCRDVDLMEIPHEAALAGGQGISEAYEIRLQRADAFDFGDLIMRPGDLLAQDEWLQKAVRRRWQWIMVDEFQDTNVAQYRWLKLMAPPGANLLVVGDDDQSIYGWRGAEVGNILNFQEVYPSAEVIRLEQNYRSTSVILTAANAVIGHNAKRLGKSLWTAKEGGMHIEIHRGQDARDEARWVASQIGALCRESDVRPGDVAVFFRTNSLSLDMEEALRFEAVPYVVFKGRSFYQRAEIKDALAFIRLLVNPDDDVAFKRAVNTPPRGVGATSLKKLSAYAKDHGVSLGRAAPMAVQEKLLRGRAHKGLGVFVELLDRLRDPGERGPEAQARAILIDSGFLPELAAESVHGPEERVENVERLLVAIEAYARDIDERGTEPPTLGGFLETVKLASEADLTELEAGAVSLMTVHAAKGLEFPVVFVVGMEEGIFPHGLSTHDAGIEEERRLCYVALTRAQERLYLTYARARQTFGGVRYNRPSRFLAELPEDLLSERVPRPSSVAPPGGGSRWRERHRRQRVKRPERPKHQPVEPGSSIYIEPLDEAPPEHFDGPVIDVEGASEPFPDYDAVSQVVHPEAMGEANFQVGMAVYHGQFGVGRVTEVEAGQIPRVTVDFPDVGTRRIVARFLSVYEGAFDEGPVYD
ncbi:MAG: ATP-dependent helicase [Bradymonadia bacterium]